VFVDADRLKTGLFIKPAIDQLCRIEATLDKRAKDAPYEQAQAVCHAVDATANNTS